MVTYYHFNTVLKIKTQHISNFLSENIIIDDSQIYYVCKIGIPKIVLRKNIKHDLHPPTYNIYGQNKQTTCVAIMDVKKR